MFVYSHSKKLCHHTIGVINNRLPGTTTFPSAIFKNPQVCSGDFCTAKDLLKEQAIIAIIWIDMAIAFVPFLRSFLFLQRSYWWLKPWVLEAHVNTHLALFDAWDKNMLIECSVTKLRMVPICVWWIIMIQALQHGIATSSLCDLLQVDKSFCCCYKTCCRGTSWTLSLLLFCWFEVVIFYLRFVGWELTMILGTLTMFTIPSSLTMSFDLNVILWWQFDLWGVWILYLCMMVVLIVIHDKLS